MMSRCLVVMLLLMGGAPHVLGADLRGSTGAVSIRIHDYSGFDARQLQQAQAQTSDTYARIGVRLDWRETVRPAEVQAGRGEWPTDTQATLTIVVLSTLMAERLEVPRHIAGYAPLTRDRGGRIAFVVGPRTQEIARQGSVEPPVVLAGVISHEVAHLLMPHRSHSDDGLMRAKWTPAEFRHVRRRRFTVDEAAAILQTVRSMVDEHTRVAD
ncbi:MAG: hypothetical protein AB7H96_05550 [Vicinamibacterales bacterium]